MKSLAPIVFVFAGIVAQGAWACDAVLGQTKGSIHGKTPFAKDCEFQDRYAKLKDVFARYGRNIEDVTIYKSLRFINIKDYERNLQTQQLAPTKIYEPAPDTWRIWESGVDQAMRQFGERNSLLKKNNVAADVISYMNKILMERNGISLKDKGISSNITLGVYRNYTTNSSGYCINAASGDQGKEALESQKSISQFQRSFESKTGMSFKKMVAQRGGKWADMATMDPGLTVRELACGPQLSNSFMYYTPGHLVEYQIDWLRAFADEVIQSYRRGSPLVAPTEFSAIVQKWIVSIHPFIDGNGRTSRGVQDMITRSFGVPFVNAGALQNDVLETLPRYIEKTYQETDKMLGVLEGCARALQAGQSLNYNCKSIQEHR